MPVDVNQPLVAYLHGQALFSAEDVTAVVFLRLLFPRVTVVQCTATPQAKASNYVYINFGRIYNPDQGLFDRANNTLTFSDKHTTPMGASGMVWKEYGRRIVRKFGGNDDDDYIYNTVYSDFVRVVEQTAELQYNMPASYVILINSFNTISDADKSGNIFSAIAAAEPLVHRLVQASVLRGNVYLNELPILEQAFETRTTEHILVLPVVCHSALLFLAENDRLHEVEFVIQPRDVDNDTWQVWSLGNIPLLSSLTSHDILRHRLKFMQVDRKLAVTLTRSSAQWLAQTSYDVYYSVLNYPRRLFDLFLA
jgi:uncharacterized UPF0160 family protein